MISPDTLQAWSTFLLIVTAVAGGIAVVTGFTSTILSNRASDALQSAANKKIADTNATAATAAARVEEAKAVAAKANESTAMLARENTQLKLDLKREQGARGAMLDELKPRDITKEQMSSLVNNLRGQAKRVTVYTLSDTEAFFFGNALMDAFRQAGIEVQWMYPPPLEFRLPGIASTGITLYEYPNGGDGGEGHRLMTAMVAAGVYPMLLTPTEPIPGVPSPAMFVARKQPPFTQFPAYLKPPELEAFRPPWDPKPFPPKKGRRRKD